ncbi:MAG: cytochrome c biogenesis CcdA family protein [Bacillota bacterium]
MLATAFAAGVLSFLSPCIIPMLSVYFTLITGLSFKDLEDGKVPASLRWSVLARTGAFVLAFTLVFTAAGALAGQAGQAFGRAFGGLRYFEWLGGAIVILFGLGLMGWIKVPIDRLLGHLDFDYQRLAGRHRLLTAFLVGLVFAVVCSHCIGYTLYSLLLVAGVAGSASTGAALLAAFSVGLALPYLAVGWSMGSVIPRLRGALKYRRAVAFVAGVIMVSFGVAVVTGRFTAISGWFSRWLRLRPGLGM